MLEPNRAILEIPFKQITRSTPFVGLHKQRFSFVKDQLTRLAQSMNFLVQQTYQNILSHKPESNHHITMKPLH
jgi:hypothetical protein